MELLLIELVSKYPSLSTALMVIGALRVTVKPLMAYYESHVQSTSDKEDDERLKKLKASKVYKALVFLLDYTASIKLPKAK